MRLWYVKTLAGQTISVVATNSTEALAVFHKCFTGEKEIKALTDEGHVYTKYNLRMGETEL